MKQKTVKKLNNIGIGETLTTKKYVYTKEPCISFCEGCVWYLCCNIANIECREVIYTRKDKEVV